MVAYVLNENLQHVRTIRLWRGEFGQTPPFDIGPDTLFVAYSAWAEMTCFMVLGWQFPVHIFDLHTAYLAASNILLPYNPDEMRKRQRKRLVRRLSRLRHRRLGAHRQGNNCARISAKGRWREYGREACFRLLRRRRAQVGAAVARSNCAASSAIYCRVDVEHVLHWSNYSAKAIAQIQARGMPIDMALWNLVQENKAAVIAELLRQFDPSHGSETPIYTPEGEWSYARFERWLVQCRRHGLAALGKRSARHRR